MTAKAMLFSEAIVRGSDITKAAALASPLFSSLTIEFLIVGESSGALATMLKEAALLLEQDFTASFIGTCTFNYYIVSDWCYDFYSSITFTDFFNGNT